MAYGFNNFCQNILNIHTGFTSSTLSQGMPLVEESHISKMDTFEPFTETDMWRVSGFSDKHNYKDS